MNDSKQTSGWFRKHIFSLILLIAALLLSFWAVKHFKKAGQMSVIESQAMDMTAMKAPLGSVPVATEVVYRAPFSSSVKYTGTVAPLNEQNIYPRVEGWLTGLKVYNGDKVKAGQLLAVIDSPDIGSKVAEAAYGHSAALRDIPISRANLQKAKAERNAAQKEVLSAVQGKSAVEAQIKAADTLVVQAQKELKSSQAALVYRQAEFKRAGNLLKQGAVSQEEYDLELSEITSAEADVESKAAKIDEANANLQAIKAELQNRVIAIESAKDRVAAANAAISATQSEILQKGDTAKGAGAAQASAQIVNQYRQIHAPFDGVVTKRYLSPGVVVSPGQAILNIAQINKVRIQANISDKDVSFVSIGAKLTARFPRFPNRKVNAVISSLSPLSDQTSRTSVAEAIIDNPGLALYPGDFAILEIATSFNNGAITVPASAIVTKNGRTAVWITKEVHSTEKITYTCTMHPQVKEDKPGICPICKMDLVPMNASSGKKAHITYVVVGSNSGDRTEILSGINAGDEVIYQGHRYLKEGDSIASVKWGENGPEELPPPAGGGMKDMPGMNHGNKNPAPAGGSMENMPNMPGMNHGKQTPAPVVTPMKNESMPGMNMKSDSSENSKKSGMKSASSPKAVKAVKKYTCPMHLEFVTTDPNARCPKCGMSLEEVKEKR
ncbi:MAG: efflux RND transporter periplasmic adaptor subunit [Armatimonadota bacterium]